MHKILLGIKDSFLNLKSHFDNLGHVQNTLALALAVLIITIGTYQRYISIDQTRASVGDMETHIQAVTDLIYGINPYVRTVESYKNLENDPGDKGYAYLPGIMYINFLLYTTQLFLKFNTTIDLSLYLLFALPSIIASIFIGIFFIKTFYKTENAIMIFGLLCWFFNSYFFLKNDVEGYDAITVCLLLWAFYYLEKDDVLSSTFYSLAVIFKTFPIIVGFIFLSKAKNKVVFLATGLIILITFSLPFLTSITDFTTYIQGALLVHGDRFVQGRPYLYYISYYYKVEIFQLIPFKVYSISAIVSGWIATIVLLWSKIWGDKYKLSAIPFITFYVLTPVLNRTYLVWGIPFFLMSAYSFFGKRHRVIFYGLNIAYWVFTYFYLLPWKDGFHISHP